MRSILSRRTVQPSTAEAALWSILRDAPSALFRMRPAMRRRLVVYFPLAGPAVPAELLDHYTDTGVDIVECGWPARNPYLDGPDVRASMARALSGGPAPALKAVRNRRALKPAGPKTL